jgi:Domain of unknown function (DUF5060)/Protein of unknown function (DUF4038)/Domain of unknown function (DUF5605)
MTVTNSIHEAQPTAAVSAAREVEQWGIFELALQGPSEGNPFLEVELTARFTYKHRAVEVDGFYDGDGIYRVRFMPDTPGTWSYRTESNSAALRGAEGTFTCVAPTAGNHGPVRVANTYHFAYADGTPFKQIGTTCYVWTHQGDALEEQTLATLREAPFNKLRMCVFPKSYAFNNNEPPYYPFPVLSKGPTRWQGGFMVEGSEGWSFDWSHFEPEFFRHFEQRVGDLRDLGIEADIILFHPYDRWGFATMDAATDDRYLRYVVARLAAYRNVWWSMANEFDFIKNKTLSDWDRFFRIVQESDPYGHLRSIHNGWVLYDHSQPWVTHQSIQKWDLENVAVWREQHKKPVVVDECAYEGNIPQRWGNITGEEMVRRFWEGTAQGGYVGHSDTFLDPDEIVWWSKGGTLHGQSAPRLAFLRQILEEGPAAGLDPFDRQASVASFFPCAGHAHEYYLVYFGNHQPAQMPLVLPEGEQYRGEILDTWAMTRTPLAEPVHNGTVISLDQKPYQALVLRRSGAGNAEG